jgi:hypothetical protein
MQTKKKYGYQKIFKENKWVYHILLYIFFSFVEKFCCSGKRENEGIIIRILSKQPHPWWWKLKNDMH